jgi:hypothetical protein
VREKACKGCTRQHRAVILHVLVQFLLSALMSLSVMCTGRLTSLMNHHMCQNKFVINVIIPVLWNHSASYPLSTRGCFSGEKMVGV